MGHRMPQLWALMLEPGMLTTQEKHKVYNGEFLVVEYQQIMHGTAIGFGASGHIIHVNTMDNCTVPY